MEPDSLVRRRDPPVAVLRSLVQQGKNPQEFDFYLNESNLKFKWGIICPDVTASARILKLDSGAWKLNNSTTWCANLLHTTQRPRRIRREDAQHLRGTWHLLGSKGGPVVQVLRNRSIYDSREKQEAIQESAIFTLLPENPSNHFPFWARSWDGWIYEAHWCGWIKDDFFSCNVNTRIKKICILQCRIYCFFNIYKSEEMLMG